MGKKVQRLLTTVEELHAYAPVNELVRRIQADLKDLSSAVHAECAPPKLLDHFSGMDRIGLHHSYLIRRLQMRYLTRGTVRGRRNELHVVLEAAMQRALAYYPECSDPAVVYAWWRGPFDAQVQERNRLELQDALSGSRYWSREPASLLELPLCYADTLLELRALGAAEPDLEDYWLDPALFVRDLTTGSGAARPLALRTIRDMKRVDAGFALHDQDKVRAGIIENGVIVRPELMLELIPWLGDATEVCALRPLGMEIGDKLVRSALDARLGARREEAAHLAAPGNRPKPSPDAAEPDPLDLALADALDPAHAAMFDEVRDALAELGLAELLGDILGQFESASAVDPASAVGLAARLIALVATVRDAESTALKAAVVFVWAKEAGAAKITRSRVCDAFSVAPATLGRRMPEARDALMKAGMVCTRQ